MMIIVVGSYLFCLVFLMYQAKYKVGNFKLVIKFGKFLPVNVI